MKRKVITALVPVAAMVSSVPALAQEASGTANSAVVTAMTSTAQDMTATGTAILPIALGVIGLILVVTFGIKIFKGIVRK